MSSFEHEIQTIFACAISSTTIQIDISRILKLILPMLIQMLQSIEKIEKNETGKSQWLSFAIMLQLKIKTMLKMYVKPKAIAF